jgi:hypothetical protein
VKHHDDELTLDIFEDTKPVTPPSADEAYLTYAMSVVTSRALPGLEDGQKPVQRASCTPCGPGRTAGRRTRSRRASSAT